MATNSTTGLGGPPSTATNRGQLRVILAWAAGILIVAWFLLGFSSSSPRFDPVEGYLACNVDQPTLLVLYYDDLSWLTWAGFFPVSSVDLGNPALRVSHISVKLLGHGAQFPYRRMSLTLDIVATTVGSHELREVYVSTGARKGAAQLGPIVFNAEAPVPTALLGDLPEQNVAVIASPEAVAQVLAANDTAQPIRVKLDSEGLPPFIRMTSEWSTIGPNSTTLLEAKLSLREATPAGVKVFMFRPWAQYEGQSKGKVPGPLIQVIIPGPAMPEP